MKSKDIVLDIQDTTAIKYTTLNKAKDMGNYTSSEGAKGVLLHTSLAVETNGNPLGILDQQIWSRNPNEIGKSKNRIKLSTEEKESNKWLKSFENSIEGVPKGIRVVTVCDREADIYDFFNKVVINEKEFLVRIVQNRVIEEEHKRLKKQINTIKVSGEVLVSIPRNTRLNIKPRIARLAIKFCEVTIKPPQRRIKDKALKPLKLYVILAEEVNCTKSIEPISWLLLTNISVKNVKNAIEKVNWYRQRWKIERFHYILKSGCKIEELQLAKTDRIKNAIAIYSLIAWKILCLTYYSRETPNISCEFFLEKYEWKALCCRVTKKSIPPKNPPTLKEAVNLIAKLGGFLGAKGDGHPGTKTIWKGLKHLSEISKMWLILTGEIVH